MKIAEDIIRTIQHNLTIDQFVDLINSIEKNSKKFIEDIVKNDVIIDRPDLIGTVEQDDDFANLKVGDFISYHFTKGNNPIKKLIEVYKLLTKKLKFRATGFVTGNFDSISFEQIPEHPIAKINFSEKRNVTITAKNNVIEFSL